MPLTIALVNRKAGTSRTTSAMWLAHAYIELGMRVLLVDADPMASAAKWSDIAARNGEPMPLRIAMISSRDMQARVHDLGRRDDVVIIDSPHLEDHQPVARACMMLADELIVPVAPAPIEVHRAVITRENISKIQQERSPAPRSCVLLTRCVANAISTGDARTVLTDAGFDVMRTTIPRRELFAGSFGGPVYASGTAFMDAARELLERAGIYATT